MGSRRLQGLAQRMERADVDTNPFQVVKDRGDSRGGWKGANELGGSKIAFKQGAMSSQEF